MPIFTGLRLLTLFVLIAVKQVTGEAFVEFFYAFLFGHFLLAFLYAYRKALKLVISP
jgi:hypothetical protein